MTQLRSIYYMHVVSPIIYHPKGLVWFSKAPNIDILKNQLFQHPKPDQIFHKVELILFCTLQSPTSHTVSLLGKPNHVWSKQFIKFTLWAFSRGHQSAQTRNNPLEPTRNHGPHRCLEESRRSVSQPVGFSVRGLEECRSLQIANRLGLRLSSRKSHVARHSVKWGTNELMSCASKLHVGMSWEVPVQILQIAIHCPRHSCHWKILELALIFFLVHQLPGAPEGETWSKGKCVESKHIQIVH